MRAKFLALLALVFVGAPAEAQERIDMRLSDAGFLMRPVDSAQKMERARLLPPRKIVSRNKAGKRYYLYADLAYCKCVMVGDDRALQSYRDMGQPAVPLPESRGNSVENEVIRSMDSDFEDGEPDDILSIHF